MSGDHEHTSLMLSAQSRSLTLQRGLPIDQYVQIGEQLKGMSSYLQWWIGDYINFGQSEYGSKYEAAVEKLGLNLKTAQDYAWVARQYQSSDRSELSWTHHKVAAGISDESERQELLQQAVEGKWSVSRLRQEIKADSAPLRLQSPVKLPEGRIPFGDAVESMLAGDSVKKMTAFCKANNLTWTGEGFFQVFTPFVLLMFDYCEKHPGVEKQFERHLRCAIDELQSISKLAEGEVSP